MRKARPLNPSRQAKTRSAPELDPAPFRRASAPSRGSLGWSQKPPCTAVARGRRSGRAGSGDQHRAGVRSAPGWEERRVATHPKHTPWSRGGRTRGPFAVATRYANSKGQFLLRVRTALQNAVAFRYPSRRYISKGLRLAATVHGRLARSRASLASRDAARSQRRLLASAPLPLSGTCVTAECPRPIQGLRPEATEARPASLVCAGAPLRSHCAVACRSARPRTEPLRKPSPTAYGDKNGRPDRASAPISG